MSITQDPSTTTTSSVDVSGFEQMLEKEDLSIPCEIRPYWHQGGVDPATWATWWMNVCACARTFLFACDPCVQRLRTDETTLHTGVRCSVCGTTNPGPIRRYLVRLERIK